MRNKKPLCGVGINDVDYPVHVKVDNKRVLCPYYKVWHNMIHRCYNPKYRAANITYEGCSVQS